MMKKIVFLISIMLMISAVHLFAQSSQLINYQAVARDTDGDILQNEALVVELSILEGSVGGTIVWQEGHSVTTNDFGLFTLKIGAGTSTGSGTLSSFDSIKWSMDDYFFNVRVDFGNGLVDMGTTRFLSVPYAMYALTAGNSAGGNQNLSIVDHDLSISNGNTVTLPDNIDDADADSTNEIQTLSLAGNNLGISGGNSVLLPGGLWDKTNNVLNYSAGNVSINTQANYHDSTLLTITDSVRKNIPALMFLYSKGSDNFFNKSVNLLASIDASNGDNSAIEGTSIGNSGGMNKGVSGFSSNANSNYGLYGESQAGSIATNSNYGVYGTASGTTNATNTGIEGTAIGSTVNNFGVRGRTAGTGSRNYGVLGESSGAGSGENIGVYGTAKNGGYINYGVLGESQGKGSYNIGLGAKTEQEGNHTNYGTYSGADKSKINYGVYSRASDYWGASSFTKTNYAFYADAFGGDDSNYAFYGNKGVLFNRNKAGIGIATPNSQLQVNGSFSLPIKTSATATYTVTANDYTVLCNNSGGVTLNLPTASGISGRIYVIKQLASSGTVTITPSGSETIDGAGSKAISTQYQSMTLQSDGSNWFVIGVN